MLHFPVVLESFRFLRVSFSSLQLKTSGIFDKIAVIHAQTFHVTHDTTKTRFERGFEPRSRTNRANTAISYSNQIARLSARADKDRIVARC